MQAQAPGQQVSVGSLSALAEMHPCSTHLALHLYGRGRYRNVRVSCPIQGWQLYVPVTLISSQHIIVAVHDLQAGVILNPSDIKTEKAARAQGVGGPLAHERQAVIGHTLRAPVSSGTPIRLSSLSQPVRVHAGQTVTVEVRADGVRIKATAIALQDGRVGQSILVKNPDSGHRYRVQVTSRGVIDDLSG